LNVFPIAVPALRERDSDILLLANTFLARHASRHGIEKISFSKNCEKAIISHHWPGNVRELENAVERAVILADVGKKIEAELLGIADVRTQVEAKSKVSSDTKKQMRNQWKMLSGSTFKRFWNPAMGIVPMPLKSLV
jgi:DNA-binding NtrC family response regulator